MYSVVSFFFSFCHAPKRPSPFFLYIPQKKPSFNDKVWTIDFLSLVFSDLRKQQTYSIQLHVCQQMGKKLAHPWTYVPPWKIPFINAIQPFYGCQRNVRKNITVTVSVRISVTIGAGTVWAVAHTDFWRCGPPMYLAHTEFLSVGPPNKRKQLRLSTIPFFQVQQTIRKRTGLLIQRNVLKACLVFCLDSYCRLNGSSCLALMATSTTGL